MGAEAKRSQREEVKMGLEASLLNIEKIGQLGALLQLLGSTPAFKKSIQALMEQIACEMSLPTEAAPLLDTSPCAPPALAGFLSPQGSARSTSSSESSLAVSPSGGFPGALLFDTLDTSQIPKVINLSS